VAPLGYAAGGRDPDRRGEAPAMSDSARPLFLVARNPQHETRLPYLLRLPLEGGLVLKARDTWPRISRIYCHPFEGDWPSEPEIVERVPVASCRRRGAAIDLVLDRPRLARSQFVFTEVRGRPAIFWQTQKTARAANPGGRVPRRRALADGFTVLVDSRERYPYRLAGREVTTERAPLVAGDYAVRGDQGELLAAVERKTLEDLASALSEGTLAFQLQRLAELPLAAVVVEGRYPALFKLEREHGTWLADVLARLQVRYPEVQVIFADSRRFAEEWTYRFLAAALADAGGA
jgi:ERCC4 domain